MYITYVDKPKCWATAFCVRTAQTSHTSDGIYANLVVRHYTAYSAVCAAQVFDRTKIPVAFLAFCLVRKDLQ